MHCNICSLGFNLDLTAQTVHLIKRMFENSLVCIDIFMFTQFESAQVSQLSLKNQNEEEECGLPSNLSLQQQKHFQPLLTTLEDDDTLTRSKTHLHVAEGGRPSLCFIQCQHEQRVRSEGRNIHSVSFLHQVNRSLAIHPPSFIFFSASQAFYCFCNGFTSCLL